MEKRITVTMDPLTANCLLSAIKDKTRSLLMVSQDAERVVTDDTKHRDIFMDNAKAIAKSIDGLYEVFNEILMQID